jgi:glycosyltransferase involved in cell wall biosynthesis
MAGPIDRQSADGRPVSTDGPRFSLVIPAHDEEACLPRLLDTVDAARRAYVGGAAAIEVIVVDDASADRTAEIACERGCRVTTIDARRIAKARNAGARAAAGDVLAFIDADSRVHPETFNVIDRLLRDGRVVGGTSGAVFERRSAGLWCTQAALAMIGVAARGWDGLTRPAMDTGVVFCQRSDFETVGGYRERYSWGEDVWLLFDLRQLGWRTGRHLAGATASPAVFSTRKFDRYGDWHYFTLPFRLFWDVIRRRTGTAQRYWYGVR